jgi:glutamate racemase
MTKNSQNAMNNQARLGILDWGIGGLSIYKLLKARLGAVPICYFSDTGVTPYGRMARAELIARLSQVSGYLKTQGVTQLVIGCNAASTALPWLQVPGLKVAGVIESAVQLTASLRPARLALIGGRRTVLSGVYRRAFAARGIGVAQRIAQPLSALIESGDVSSAELRAQCRRILMPVKGCSHLLLACTHYPAIAPVLQEFMAAETVLINPASALVTQIERWPLPVGGADVFLTTGAPAGMKRAAWQAFGVRLQAVRQLKL